MSVFVQAEDCTPKIGWIPLGTLSAKGTNGQVQYNDNGKTAGAEIYYDKASGGVGIGNITPSESLDVNGNIKSNSFIGDGSSLTGVVTSETDPTVPADIKDGISWTEIADRPAGLDDGDNVGLTSETDPTVPADIKDGISWTEIADRPAGLDDGDDVGLTSETDPQVGENVIRYIPKWDGSALSKGTIYDNGKVGIGTSSPRGQLEVGGTDGLVVTGSANSGTVQALGAGVRMQWYPRKGAFRVGMAETSYWDDDGTTYPKLALYSIGMGYQPRATGVASTAIGAYNQATGDYSLSLGSYSHATASHSVAIGTQAYATGIYSIALGSGADTNGHDGAMVIGDDTYFQTAYANSDNQLTMRFTGGNGASWTQDNCGTGSASYRLWSSYPDCTAGVYMTSHGSGWSNYSSRRFKENFRELDGEELLGKIRDMSITEWNYKATPENKYIGPVAEEFREAFHLNGDDEAGINSISIDGVNMAGVQALEKRTSTMKAEMAEMKSEIELLKAEIETLKTQLAAK
ncbi:MAG: tail fiber domain-containing protein [Desulfocapsaceae bacterium]|nr:tail fiber domain-containing protein [Desulfocapsaceae bacterium]